jgi:epimerase transport system membrane fusion protein
MKDADSQGENRGDERSARRLGLIVVITVFGVFGVWAATATLEGAVVAAGQVTVESYKKTVQHLEGGIIKSIEIHEADLVKKGQVLLRIEDTQSRSQLEVLRGQLFISLAREARLIAQRDGAARVSYPETLNRATSDARAIDAIKVQNQTFAVRRAAHEGEIILYARQIQQLRAKHVGLLAQKKGRDLMVESYGREWQDLSSLLSDGYTEIQKVRDAERSLAQAQGQQGELAANVAATELQISETELKIIQLQKELQREIAKELAEVQGDVFSLREKFQLTEDTVSRAVVTAPEAGRVLGLSVHTVGAVVPPGGRLLEVVPQEERLILEAQVSPNDIDRLHVGQEAEVRFSTFKARDVPRISGHLLSVSADRLTDEGKGERQSFFLARVEVGPSSLRELAAHHLTLVPGMPAEIMINTGGRTLLQYLMRPLSDTLARGLRES